MNRKGGAQTDIIVKLVLIFFINLLSFSVGTFVGKQFSDSQHKLASLEDDYGSGNRETASVTTDDLHEKNNGKQHVTEKEIAEIAKEFVDSERSHMEASPYKSKTAKHVAKASKSDPQGGKTPQNNEHAAVARSKTPAKSAQTNHQKTPDGVEKIAHILASNETPAPPTAPVKEVRQPSSLPKSVSSSIIGKYTVQVASYATENEADKHARELAAKGFPAFYIPAIVNGKNWFRVSVGSFSARQQALDYKKQLMQQASLTSAIIQKVTN
jgi:cell division protein FtsN